PTLFRSRFGFAWFGGLLGGFIALLFLARRFGIPALEFLDMCSPAAAVGYAIGRIGCLLSGDGDYGGPTTLPWGMSFPNGVVPTVERVHPTPLYEFFIWLVIGAILWRLGKRALTGAGPKGEDRKSTRLNSSHGSISYAVFCLKKKTNKKKTDNVT